MSRREYIHQVKKLETRAPCLNTKRNRVFLPPPPRNHKKKTQFSRSRLQYPAISPLDSTTVFIESSRTINITRSVSKARQFSLPAGADRCRKLHDFHGLYSAICPIKKTADSHRKSRFTEQVQPW